MRGDVTVASRCVASSNFAGAAVLCDYSAAHCMLMVQCDYGATELGLCIDPKSADCACQGSDVR